jgi:hypothetical protein
VSIIRLTGVSSTTRISSFESMASGVISMCFSRSGGSVADQRPPFARVSAPDTCEPRAQ